MTVEVAVGTGDGAGIGVALLRPGRVGVTVAEFKVALLVLGVVLGGVYLSVKSLYGVKHMRRP